MEVLPPVLPPPGQNPRIFYASFLGAQDPRISYASLVSFTAVSPLLSSLFFCPFFSPAFCSFPLFSSGLVNVAFNREGSNSELVVAATAAVVVPLMIFMEVQGGRGESKRRRGRGGTGVTSEKGEKEPKRCYYRQETVSKERRRRKKNWEI